MATGWFERLLGTIAERGRSWIRIPTDLPPLERICALARNLVSEKGEASGAALADAVLELYRSLDEASRDRFLETLATEYAPDPARLAEAAGRYLAEPGAETASALAGAADPPRQELLRRLNMGRGGTATLIEMRETVLARLHEAPSLLPLENDLKHLLMSWFNRGFLELRRIDWHTPAAVLEKLIAYEAVHEITGWDDLRRRLDSDRRCFGFFHPALDDDPLIFVEVALVRGLAGAIGPLLDPVRPSRPGKPADTAIFYSINNCLDGLRGISFGNFLIKQVVEELKAEMPGLRRFATLSPVPGFRRWVETRDGAFEGPLGEALEQIEAEASELDPDMALRLKRLCAEFLTASNEGRGPADPVARFHLRNGARLERINYPANPSPRGIAESWGLMVNYLYDPEKIEAYHEAFVRQGEVAHSPEVAQLLREEAGLGVANLLPFGATWRH
ncbi:MAG TPA: malonyl-CoA decarboxylase family protein [Stellaceae bacterium]|nr:malonyl-CoA decarboxylase family protein [Stellaceae bacterium]